MALQVKVQRMKKKGEPDKWYGKTVKRQDVTLEQIATMISMKNSVTESDVFGVLKALIHEMKFFLQLGHTVKLDGFGNFHLTIESEMVDHENYNFPFSVNIEAGLCRSSIQFHAADGIPRIISVVLIHFFH